MLWNLFRKRDLTPIAERMRREHSHWLTKAVLSGRRYPSIPSRRVDRGGYDGLRDRANGSARAEQWWGVALERVEDREASR